MDFHELKITKDDADRRLDRILRKFLPELPLGEIYRLLRKGFIKLNGKKVSENQRASEGDTLQIASFLLNGNKTGAQTGTSSISAEDDKNFPQNTLELPFPVIFQNEHILIIDKPYDICVHGDENSLEKIVGEYWSANFQNKSISFKPGPLHRLDRKTTGLIAFGMDLEGARWFSAKISAREIKKIYLGIIQGNLEKEELWEDKIERDDDKNTLKKSTKQPFKTSSISTSGGGKIARTKITPLEHGIYKNQQITLAKFDIFTGRTHQIRAQSSYHGHPLLGDSAYGGKIINKNQDFFLHAWKLILPENPLGIPVEIESAPPSFFQLLFHNNL